MRRAARTIGTAVLAAALGAAPLAASAQADYGSADYDDAGAAPATTATWSQSGDLSALAVPARSVHVMPVSAEDVPLDATFVDGGALAQATVIDPTPGGGYAPQGMSMADYLVQHGIDPNAVLAVTVNGDMAMPSQVAGVTIYVDRDAMDTSSST